MHKRAQCFWAVSFRLHLFRWMASTASQPDRFATPAGATVATTAAASRGLRQSSTRAAHCGFVSAISEVRAHERDTTICFGVGKSFRAIIRWMKYLLRPHACHRERLAMQPEKGFSQAHLRLALGRMFTSGMPQSRTVRSMWRDPWLGTCRGSLELALSYVTWGPGA